MCRWWTAACMLKRCLVGCGFKVAFLPLVLVCAIGGSVCSGRARALASPQSLSAHADKYSAPTVQVGAFPPPTNLAFHPPLLATYLPSVRVTLLSTQPLPHPSAGIRLATQTTFNLNLFFDACRRRWAAVYLQASINHPVYHPRMA